MRTYDLAAAADFLKVDPATVKKMAQRGVFGAKVGRAWVFREEDLDAYLRDLTISQTEARKVAMAPAKLSIVRRRPLPALQHVGHG